MHLTRGVLTAGALCASLALAACGDDKKDEEGGDAAKPAALTVTATEKGKSADFDAPETVKGGTVALTFQNNGKKSHELQIISVDGDQTGAEVLKAIDSEEGAPIPPWLHTAGGVGTTAGGKTGQATVNLEAGTHYLVDTGDEEEGVEPIAVKLDVTEGEAGALPPTTASIAMSEYAFAPSGLKAGKNTILLKNTGKELHHTIAFPIAPGKTFAEVKKVFASDGPPTGPPPVIEDKITGTSVLDGGLSQVTELDLIPGKYALVCFISDRKGGPPHVAKGMITEADIK